jgi:hypothetical protein
MSKLPEVFRCPQVTCCAAASRENACCGLARFPGGHRPGHRQRPCRRRCETARHTSQPVAISRCGSSTPTMKRSCFRRRAVAGIEDVISRADLADRGIFLTLAPIGERQRRSEAELWREFEIARPRILGALLDATMRGLRTLPNVRLTSLPRMADFVLWATACEPGLWSAPPLPAPMTRTAERGRGEHRAGLGGALRAGPHGRARQLGGDCLRPSACRQRSGRYQGLQLALKSRCPRGPAASCADVPSYAGH